MNLMLTTVGAVAAVAKVASKAYNYAEQFGVFNREAKVEAETRSVEVADNQSADVGIPVFNGSGYEIWSSMMKTFFVSQDLWDMVDRGYEEEELTVEVLREVRKRDAMALLFIQQAIDKSVFSCIASASKSKEAWDALQKKYQGDESQNSVDESSLVSSFPADATEFREAWDEPEQGYKANTKVHAQPQAGNPNGGVSQSLTTLRVGNLDANVTVVQLLGIFMHFGQVVSSSVSRDMATQCSLGYGYVTYANPQDADRALKELNFTPLNGKPIQIMYFQQDSTEHESGGFNTKKSDYGGIDGAHFNNNQNQGGHVGTDGGCFNNKDSTLSGYNSKNPNFESVSSCSTNATESREASDAPQQGHQANTDEVKAKPQVGNPSGGRILIKNLDKAIDDGELRAIFSAFGNILYCKVRTDTSGRSKGYGHIEYDSEGAAQEAIEKLNGTRLNHKKVYVDPFASKQEMAKSTKVYVANLSESTTKEDLREVFGDCGTIANTVVVRDGDGKSKCFGFVKFKDANDASWSIAVLNGHKFDNKEWCVISAQKKSVRRAKNT